MRFVKFLFLLPIAIVLVLFGVANRQMVTLVLDPISPSAQAFGISLPLFVFFFVTLAAGAVLGSITTWLAQGRHRRAERQLRRESARLRDDVAALKSQLPATDIARLSSR